MEVFWFNYQNSKLVYIVKENPKAGVFWTWDPVLRIIVFIPLDRNKDKRFISVFSSLFFNGKICKAPLKDDVGETKFLG